MEERDGRGDVARGVGVDVDLDWVGGGDEGMGRCGDGAM